MVVLAGLLRPYKGVDIMLDAWPRIHRAVPDAHLIIAGRPMGVELPDSPPAGVTIVPRFLDEAEYSWLMRRADVVCLPYRAIDMSGVLMAAIGLGTPVVASDVGGFGEFAGQGALIVEPENTGQLAETLTALLADTDLQSRLQREAATAAATTYSWDRIASVYTERYRSLTA